MDTDSVLSDFIVFAIDKVGVIGFFVITVFIAFMFGILIGLYALYEDQ